MNLRKTLLPILAPIGFFAAGMLIAQHPVDRRLIPTGHPNIIAAQRLTDEAAGKVAAARTANEWDLDGHAARAKELLTQASRELTQAAESLNRNRH
jgi:hypothetical protein